MSVGRVKFDCFTTGRTVLLSAKTYSDGHTVYSSCFDNITAGASSPAVVFIALQPRRV